MGVMVWAVLLLVAAPAALLWLGRRIERVTDGRHRVAAAATGAAGAAKAGSDADPGAASTEASAWFRRPMQPAFKAPLWSKKA